MENENFDADLKNHIKQIFENYDDGHANEGWNLLREKYPEKNKHRYFFWWLGAAVLLFTFLLIWFFQPETDHLKSVKNTKPIQTNITKTPVKADLSIGKSIIKTDSSDTMYAEKSLVKTASKLTAKQKQTQQKTAIFNSAKTETNQINKHNNTVFSNVKLDSADHKNNQTQVLNLIKTNGVNQKDTPLTDIANNEITKSNTKKDVIKTVSAKKPLQKTSKFGLSLYAGPHVNFATNSNTLLSFGAGVSTDFTLSKKLKLETGLGLIQNKLFYQNKIDNTFYASLPANTATNTSGSVVVNNTSLNSFNANLLQLDVPINLVYQILPGKNSIAILAGLSSGVFAKESYQYNYVNAANDTQNSKSFQSFYLLKTLNIGAQIALPISKFNLQVEPFVKVPLGDLASQQLKFGAAGINLKLHFQPIKK